MNLDALRKNAIALLILAAIAVQLGRPKPTPTPDIKPGAINVLIVERTGDRLNGKLSKDQLAAIDGAAVRDYLAAHCPKAGDDPGWHLVDIDAELTMLPNWCSAAKDAGKTLTPPYTVVVSGSKFVAAAVRPTAAEQVAWLQTYGGK